MSLRFLIATVAVIAVPLAAQAQGPAPAFPSRSQGQPLISSATVSPGANDFIVVLGYDEPAGYYRGAGTAPVEYSSREVNASIQVYPFRPFTGNIGEAFGKTMLREWIDPRYRENQLMAAPAISTKTMPGATAVMVARFHENIGGLPNERMRLLVIAGNLAALVDLSANSQYSWDRAGPAVRAMLASLRVERMEPPAPLTAGAGPAGAALAGLYEGTKSKYVVNLNRPVGYGDHVPSPHYYLLSADGRVYCSYERPVPEGVNPARFDFAGALRADPVNTGRYMVRGNQLILQFSGQPPETITGTLGPGGTIEISSIKYTRTP